MKILKLKFDENQQDNTKYNCTVHQLSFGSNLYMIQSHGDIIVGIKLVNPQNITKISMGSNGKILCEWNYNELHENEINFFDKEIILDLETSQTKMNVLPILALHISSLYIQIDGPANVFIKCITFQHPVIRRIIATSRGIITLKNNIFEYKNGFLEV